MSAREAIPREAIRLYQQGQAYLDARPSQPAEAIRCWAEAAEVCRQAGALTTQATLLNNIGSVYSSQGDLARALAYYERALAIDEAIVPQSTETARDLNNIGSVYDSQGDLARALAYYQRALAIDEAIAPQSTETARDLNNIGSVYQQQGDLARALAYFQRALATCEAIGPQSIEVAGRLNNIGAVYQQQGDLARALAYYQRALAIDEAIAPQSTETATLLNNIGGVYRQQGDLARALEYYQRALAIFESIAPQSTETATLLNNIGGVYDSQGDLALALAYFQRALAIDEAIAPQSTGTARDLNNIGGVYNQQGDLARSLGYFRRALAIDEAIAPQSTETARDLNNIGGVYNQQGDLARSLGYFRRALAIDEAIAPQSTQTATDLNNIGRVYQFQGDLTRALEYFQRALAIDEAIAPQSTETATDLNNIGGVYRQQADLARALEYYQRALAIFESIAPQSTETATLLNNIGSVYRSQGDLARALEAFERSVEIAESLRGRAAGGQRGKAGVFAEHIGRYEATIDILARMKNPSGGFGYAERSRARGMAELLAERDVDASAQAPAGLLAEDRQLKQRLGRSYNNLLEARSRPPRNDEQIACLEAEQDQLEREIEALEARIRRECPEYADLEYPQPLGLEELQQQVLGPDDVLLEYFVGEENSYLWAVRRDRFEFRVLDLTSAELDEQVRGKFRPRLDKPGLGIDPSQQIAAARWLYERLVQPVEAFLQGAGRVLISPDGPLHYLPFEALVCGERPASNGSPFHGCIFLGERYVISYIPSATVLKNLRDALARRGDPAGNDLIGFGDPDFEAGPADDRAAGPQLVRDYAERRGMTLERIPDTGTEVREIFALFAGDTGQEPDQGEAAAAATTKDAKREMVYVASSKPAPDQPSQPILKADRSRGYLRDQASEQRARTESGDHRYVHFATHGLLDDENPLYSGIAFSPTAAARDPEGDWLLQTYEIFSIKLNADLVTLSACKTGLGKLTKGEGLVGMTRAFMYAGTPSVLVSLWSVADKATARFMVDFYRRIRSGQDKATALAETKRQMMADPQHPEYRDPFYWAAFVLQGEWSSSLGR